MIRRLALATMLALTASACTAMLGANDPIEIIGADGEAPEADAADEGQTDAVEGGGAESGQPDVQSGVDAQPGVDALAPLPDTGTPPFEAGMAPDSSPPPCEPLASVPSSDVPPWQGVTQELNACNGTQVTAFVNECGSGGNTSACDTWQQDPGNASCLSCLLGTRDGGQPDGKGAIVFTAGNMNAGFLNLPGCIALADPSSNGVTCASALEPSMQCQLFACESCDSDPTTLQGCIGAATAAGGACAAYDSDAQQACAPENAAGGVATTVCGSELGVVQVICGTGP